MRLLGLLILSMWSNLAIADEGKFTFLAQNQCAPFEGILFDPAATANILSTTQSAKNECDIKLKFNLDTQAAEHALELENLQIRHDALIGEYDMRVQSLEREADALALALKKQSKKTPAAWIAAGFLAGSAMTYAAYRTFNE